MPALEKGKVVLDAARRRDIILHDAKDLALAQGLELVEDDGLLHEVAGLVEWPVVLIGSFEEAFLDIPGEVIRATIRANQKCFVLKRHDGSLANKFVLVSNIEASDGGIKIAAGNAAEIEKLGKLGGTPEKSALVSPVSNFYFTNPIARASAVMAECSALAQATPRTLTAAE